MIDKVGCAKLSKKRIQFDSTLLSFERERRWLNEKILSKKRNKWSGQIVSVINLMNALCRLTHYRNQACGYH